MLNPPGPRQVALAVRLLAQLGGSHRVQRMLWAQTVAEVETEWLDELFDAPAAEGPDS